MRSRVFIGAIGTVVRDIGSVSPNGKAVLSVSRYEACDETDTVIIIIEIVAFIVIVIRIKVTVAFIY